MVSQSLNNKPKLLAIVGETASGKTAVSIDIAQAIDGEIICADSRTVYKKMDIGTAKPSRQERSSVAHHLLDIRKPNEEFNVSEFKILAEKCIQDISSRNRNPIVVGGTGLYVDSLLYNFHFVGVTDRKLRAELEQMNDEEITTYINDNKINVSNVNTKNRRHLIRFIERGAISPKNNEIRQGAIIMGLRLERDELRNRIISRVETMFDEGFLEEAKMVADQYGWSNQAMSGIGYVLAKEFFEGKATESEVKEAFIKRDMSLAKRQRTWFKRNKNIRWFDNPEELSRSAIELYR